MTASFSLTHIAWKRILIFLFLIIAPNYLVMQAQLAGPIDDWIGLGTAVDLVIILPLLLYFFGFKKRVSWLVLCGFVFWGLLLANWMIPYEADAFLAYFNHSIILLEASVLMLELFLFFSVVKKLPFLVEAYQAEKKTHYHFLSSFSNAIERTFPFKGARLSKFQFTLRVLATDIAAIYYSLFSWQRKAPVRRHAHDFTLHKNGSYLGVFIMLVHAMVIEIIAVHVMVSMYSHITAWILTALDVYALLFIISDYQAIRLCPVVLDEKGIHFQKGIRQYGFVAWEQISGIEKNTMTHENLKKGRSHVELALHGLEKEQIPHVLPLKEPVEINQFFGFKKKIETIYVKVDEPQFFKETVQSYLRHQK
ncbi:hypothetical protein [Halobacillus sp. BBL2006]|uniref:hypothetical protein n=1 Tax=Halobacillus sp. BBL2006 TaxID=1543706 RepID=UPI000A512433|nr:hypothetical protein [Halobacillus sp. BBL2006]